MDGYTSAAVHSSTGQPVGTAVMKVSSAGSAPVTIRYRINGGPEQSEANVPLPWEKQYPVYNEVESQVTADGGDVGGTGADVPAVVICEVPAPVVVCVAYPVVLLVHAVAATQAATTLTITPTA